MLLILNGWHDGRKIAIGIGMIAKHLLGWFLVKLADFLLRRLEA